jgi:general secretion pathway protein G
MPLSNGFQLPHGPRPDGQQSHAFSLLEMMAVVGLIIVLAAIAMPFYRTIIVHARESVLRDDLFTLRSQIDQFTHDNARSPASLQELVDKGYMGAVPIDPMTGSSDTWRLETEELSAVSSQLSATAAPPGVADVHSRAEGTALDGTDYRQW